MSFYCRKLLHRVASPVVALAQRRLRNAGGRLTAHNGKRARLPIVEPSLSADAAGISRARVDCRRPSRPSGIGECPDRSLTSPQVDQASPRDMRPLQTESAAARKSLAQNVAVAQSASFQARQLINESSSLRHVRDRACPRFVCALMSILMVILSSKGEEHISVEF